LPYSNGEVSILSTSSIECGLVLRVVPLRALTVLPRRLCFRNRRQQFL
jgi:hypothetical protein